MFKLFSMLYEVCYTNLFMCLYCCDKRTGERLRDTSNARYKTLDRKSHHPTDTNTQGHEQDVCKVLY